MSIFNRKKREVYCSDCKYFCSPRIHQERGGCYHSSNTTKTVTKTPESEIVEISLPIRSYLEMNAKNDCSLFKFKVTTGLLD